MSLTTFGCHFQPSPHSESLMTFSSSHKKLLRGLKGSTRKGSINQTTILQGLHWAHCSVLLCSQALTTDQRTRCQICCKAVLSHMSVPGLTPTTVPAFYFFKGRRCNAIMICQQHVGRGVERLHVGYLVEDGRGINVTYNRAERLYIVVLWAAAGGSCVKQSTIQPQITTSGHA